MSPRWGSTPRAKLGGALRPGLPARYLVIHDTSTPNCSVRGAAMCDEWGAFPADLDGGWRGNASFDDFLPAPATLKGHVLTNRTGGSLTARDFAEHVSHVRFDYCFDADAKVNLFVSVENIQPRLGDPARPEGVANDPIAPVPGFTPAQYRRLALVYIAASARAGRWLIPAYRAVLDRLYDPPTAHDDPQHFDMAAFSAALTAQIAAIRRA